MTHRIFSSTAQIPRISLNSPDQGRYGSAAMLVVIVNDFIVTTRYDYN